MEGLNKLSGQNLEQLKQINCVEDFYRIVKDAPALSSVSEEEAPFASYDENTSEVWKYVSHEEVENYLKEKLFFDTSVIPYDSMKEVGEVSSDEPIKIPLDLVVNAAGFSDWRGRSSGGKSWNIKSGETNLDGKMASIDVIKLYAGTPSDLPEVRYMQMYIQPNKKVFFDNGSGDSHRIAAAILRGDKYIETRLVFVYQLEEDYI